MQHKKMDGGKVKSVAQADRKERGREGNENWCVGGRGEGVEVRYVSCLGSKTPWWSTLHSDKSTWHPDKPHFFVACYHPHWLFIQSMNFQSSLFLLKVAMKRHCCIRNRRRGGGWDDGVTNGEGLEAIYRGNSCIYKVYLHLTENFVFDPNTKLTIVYYNGGKPPHLFRIRTDHTLSGLKGQLDQINRQLNYRDTQRVDGVEYWRPSTDSAERVWFSRMKLMRDDDVRTMFSIFGQYNTRGPIELIASLVKSVEKIQKSLIRHRNYEEIRVRTTRRHLFSWFVMVLCFI